jgi:hypothetical protein
MRLALPLLAPLLIASAPAPQQSAQPAPQFGSGAQLPENIRKNCRSRIETVREERGLPRLQRDNAAPDRPLLILAVDKRIDGCEVLVLRNNTADIRPLPEFEEGPARLQPLH